MVLSKGKNPNLPNKSATKTCTTLPTSCAHRHCFSSVSPACTYTHGHHQNSRKNRCTTLWRAVNSDLETNFAKCYKTIKITHLLYVSTTVDREQCKAIYVTGNKVKKQDFVGWGLNHGWGQSCLDNCPALLNLCL